MTIIELFFVALYLGVGFLFGNYGFHQYGWLGAITGFGIGAFGVILIVKGIARIESIFYRPLPVCRNNVCQGNDYKYVHNQQGIVVCRCKCGSDYILNGRRFGEITPEGAFHPYMKRAMFGKWIPDSESEE